MLGQEKEKEEDETETETEEQSDKRMSVDITGEKTDDKAPSSLTDSSADELSDEDQPRSSRELGNVGSAAVGGFESTDANETRETRQSRGLLDSLETFVSLLCEESEGKSIDGVPEQLRAALKEARLASHKADNETDAAGPSETHEEQPSSETERSIRWANKEDMLLSLKNEPHMQMQAICALHRYAMTMHLPHKLMGTPWILDSIYAKLTKIAKFLTDGDVLGPCRRISDELDAMYRGAAGYCSLLVFTYSTEIYEIYLEGFDLYFP